MNRFLETYCLPISELVNGLRAYLVLGAFQTVSVSIKLHRKTQHVFRKTTRTLRSHAFTWLYLLA